MSPTDQQRAVIESEELDILVEAGAGTGKTTTMVNRYIRLLRERGHEPREILAFTFTDKAAGELRDRVRSARARLAEERGESAAEFSMSSAWIGTFHAICSRILKAYPVEAGVDPGFTVIDDVTGETLRGTAFAGALAEFQREDPTGGRRERMIGLFSERVLRDTVLATFDELRSRGIAAPRLPGFDDTGYPADGIEYLRANAASIGTVKGLHFSHRARVEKLEELLGRSGGAEFTCADLSPLSFSSKKEECTEFCEMLRAVVADLAAREDGDFARRGIDRLLELFTSRFTRLKEQRSVLDYEDLQLLTLGLLRKHPRIRDAYRDRFREIMVDEFQDTNQLQLDLVAELRGPATTLITVGDEMQSIYGFRHADVELFRARRGAEGVVRYRLSDNFRSQPEVIAAINEIGLTLNDQVSEKRGVLGAASRHEFAELTVGRWDSDDPASATAVLTTRKNWKPLDLGELAPAIPEEADVGKEQDHFNEAEALRVAHHLRRLVDSGKARQGEIAILLRAKTRSDLYVNALRSVGLSPYLTGGTGFWKSREAVNLRSLLSAIANPLEDEALLGALTSPACGVSTDALWLLRRAAPDYAPLWPTVAGAAGGAVPPGSDPAVIAQLSGPDREVLARFVTDVERLRERAVTLPLDALVDELVTSTGYDLANLIRDPSRNGMANVRRVASLAHEFELTRGRDLRGFLDWVALSADLDAEASVATQEEDSDVIRIMTVHAAKGLEFKVACIPDCGRQNTSRQVLPLRLGRPTPGGDPAAFRLGLRLPRIEGEKVELYDWPELAAEARLATEDEELRLFHVALTRAEDHLIVSGVLPEREPKGISEALPMITRFAKGFGLDPETPDSWADRVPDGPEPDARIEVIANLPSPEQAEMLRRKEPASVASRAAAGGTPPLSRPPATVFPNVPLSFTALSEFEECPVRFYARRVLRLEEPDSAPEITGPEDPGSESLIGRDRATGFGLAVHDVLESLGRSRWPHPRRDMVERALDSRGAAPGDLDRAVRMIEGFVDSDLGRRVSGGESEFEVPLLIRAGGMTIRGFADVLAGGRPPLIVDYKTNDLTASSPDEKFESYRQQRNLYALAVARGNGVEEVETAFVFLDRPDRPVMDTLGPADLERAGSELEASLSDITRGRYFGGPGARNSPCGNCWACEALSSQVARAGDRTPVTA